MGMSEDAVYFTPCFGELLSAAAVVALFRPEQARSYNVCATLPGLPCDARNAIVRVSASLQPSP